MKRPWLIFEALALTLPATLLLAAGLPIAVRSLNFIGAVGSDGKGAVLDSVLALLPYLCGLFAWLMVWAGTLKVSWGGHLSPGGLFWAVAAAGFIASFDFLLVSPDLARLLVCGPVWLLAAHLMLLALHPQTQRGPQLA